MYYFISLDQTISFLQSIGIDTSTFSQFELAISFIGCNIFVFLFICFCLSLVYKFLVRVF